MLYLLETENLLKKNGKGRDSAAESYRLKYEAAGLIFLFGYVGNIRVFDTFGDWRDDEKRRKKEEDRQQGSLVSNIGNIRGLPFFRGMTEGERRERRGLFDVVFFFFIFPSFMVILWRFLAFGRGCEGEKKGKKRTL